MAPDPQKAFVARLRAAIPAATVGTALTGGRPAVVVNLLPGGSTVLRRQVDRLRFDLVCYGTDPRQLAADVRAAVLPGFTAAGNHVFDVDADPAYPLTDDTTYEVRWFLPVSASVYALP